MKYYSSNKLYIAAKAGSIKNVKYVMRQGYTDINEGMIGAAEGGHLDIVNMFFEISSNVLRNDLWDFCLYGAAKGNQIHIIKECFPWYGNKGLYGAIEGNHKDLIEHFSKFYLTDPFKNQCLCHAARGGNKKEVEKLIKTSFIESSFIDITSAIYASAEGGHEDIMIDLLEIAMSYDINLILKHASIGNHRHIIDNLFVNDLEPNINYGLIGSVIGDHRDLVDHFISLGANNWEDAFCYAVLYGHYHLAEEFEAKVRILPAFSDSWKYKKWKTIKYTKMYGNSFDEYILDYILEFV